MGTFTYSNVENEESGIIAHDSILDWNDINGIGNISEDPNVVQWGNWNWELADGTVLGPNTPLRVDLNEVTIYDFERTFDHMVIAGDGNDHDEDNFIDQWLCTDANDLFYKTPLVRDSAEKDASTISDNSNDKWKYWFTDATNSSKKKLNNGINLARKCIKPESGVSNRLFKAQKKPMIPDEYET